MSGEKYFNSLNNEQKIAAGKLLQFRENNFDDLGFTKDGLGERSPLFNKRFSDEQFIKMFDRDKGFYGPGLREGDTGEGYLFRPGNEPVFDFYAEGKLGYVYRPDDPRIFDYLGFPKEAKTQHDQYDEKGRMKMATGGGTMARRTYTPEEYQSQFVDFYNYGGIDVNVAAAAGEEEKKQELPNVLTPVSARGGGGGGGSLFSQVPISGKELQRFGTEDYVDYIKNFDTGKKVNFSDDGFQKYLEANVGSTITGLTMGPVIGGLSYGAASLARKEHRKNAGAIQASYGMAGDMFKFNNQTVSRAPGSKIFTGNLGGLSQGDMYRNREIAKGFIPGTMIESAGGMRGQDTRIAGVSGLTGVTRVEGAIMDAFGTAHGGQRDESGHMMVSAGQAQRMREQEFRDVAAKNNIDISKLQGADFVNAAVAYKQHVDGVMRQGRSFFARTSDMSSADYNAALSRRRDVGADYLRNKYSVSTASRTPLRRSSSYFDDITPPRLVETAAGQSLSEKRAKRKADEESGLVTPGTDPTFPSENTYKPQQKNMASVDTYRGYKTVEDDSAGFDYSGFFDSPSPQPESRVTTEDFSGRRSGRDMDMLASGGRVDMQAGGEAAFEPGFVEGPPENFTERETVADDQNGAVPEGTFVINAAAVEFAGSNDIRKMILDAYSTAREKGLDIGRVDRKLYEGTVDVALSKGEVVVPPDLAKIIGYDRLEKINNRGKKEVSRRQKKAGGGFLDGKKFAEGGEAPKTLPKRKPKKEALADIELRADLEEFIKDDNLARLGFSLYESGDLKLIGMPLPRGAAGATVSGQYFPKQGEDEYPVYPSGVKEVENPADASPIVKERASAAGFIMDQEGEEKAPTAVYFSEPMPHFNADRASVFITLAHELRHAALNHLANEYGVPQETLSTEERVMDFYDEKARREASKKNKSVNKKFSPESLDIDKTSARQIPKYAKKHDMYEEIAGLVLKERGYPERAVRKGRLKRFIDSFLK